MSYLADKLIPEEWKDVPATHFDGPTQAEIAEAARAAELKKAVPTKPERGRRLVEEVLATINRDRQNDYGAPEDTFAQIAAFWSAYLGTEVHAPDVAAMMQLLKIARQRGGKSKKDNFVDLVGYAILEADMRGMAV